MSTFTPNFGIASSWRSSFQNLVSQFRKQNIVVDSTFEFNDFNPEFDFYGMTSTGFRLYYARQLLINKMFWFSFHFQTTLGGVMTGVVDMTLPINPAGISQQPQYGIYRLANVGGSGPAYFYTNILGSRITLTSIAATYAAGSTIWAGNAFLEVA